MSIEIIAHRGARFEAPENTLEGFRHALALGMTTVEFDVHITADGELVVIHDATVDRTTNGTGKVHELTLAEIRTLDARSIHTLWPEPVRIPTLAEVLETLRAMPNMEIEIKRDSREHLDRVVRGVIAALRAAGRDHGAVMTSFEPYALELAMELAPEIPRGLIGDYGNDVMWYLAEKLQVERVAMGLRTATPEIVARAKAAGCRTVGWPCNDEQAVRQVLECGFDEVCTDAPSLFAPMFGKAVNRVS